MREELLRFSREIAFAAARVYASAAENRGSWDRRLEALVIDNLVSGSVVGDPLPSRLAALGWHEAVPIVPVVGQRAGRFGRIRAGLGAQPRRPASAWTRWPACTPTGWWSCVGGATDPDELARELLPRLRRRAGRDRAAGGRALGRGRR